MSQDKQLSGIKLDDVLRKRRLEQALNAKEFAVLAGVSYSTARVWFRLLGFPVFEGVVFWRDFVNWRTARTVALSDDRGELVAESVVTSAAATPGVSSLATRLFNDVRRS